MADIFEEIDEDLKQDQVYQWWKKNAKWIIAVLAIIVLVTGAYFWWTSNQQAKAGQAGADLRAAVALIETDQVAAKAALDEIIANGGTTAMLASFERAKLAQSEGDKTTAINLLEAVANNNDYDSVYRDRAKFVSLMQMMDGSNPAALIPEFEALTSGSYRFSALEMVGVLQAQTGDASAAKATLDSLKALEGVPSSMVGRVDQLLATLD